MWLRVGPLDPPSLWLDDLWVITPSQAGSASDALGMTVTAPGFSALANVLPWLVGPESWAAQLLPFAAGVAAPAVTIAVSRRIGWGWPAATVAATVTAVAPEHLLYSTRVKQYTLETLAGLVLVALAWRVLSRQSSPAALTAAAIGATVLSASSGTFAGAIVAATVLLAVSADRSRIRELTRPAGAYLGFTAVWWAVYLRSRVPEALRTYWSEDFLTVDDGVTALLVDLRDSLSRMTDGFLPVRPAWPVLVVAGAVVLRTAPRLAILLVSPLAVAVGLSALHQAPLGVGRTEIYLLPIAALMIGAAVDGVTRMRGRLSPSLTWPGVLLVCTVLIGAEISSGRRVEPYPQEDVRGFIEAAAPHLRPSDLALVYPATRWAWAVYGPGSFKPVRDDASPTGFDVEIAAPGVRVLRPHRDHPERYGPEIEAAVRGRDRVVFFASHWRDDISFIETWFLAHGWTEVRRDEAAGARRVEYVRS